MRHCAGTTASRRSASAIRSGLARRAPSSLAPTISSKRAPNGNCSTMRRAKRSFFEVTTARRWPAAAIASTAAPMSGNTVCSRQPWLS
ncbi:hypothetical protein NB706_003406 [Xanthomonas sacchari]|nr:hypothetical protein [Xanthomonas sacchari]